MVPITVLYTVVLFGYTLQIPALRKPIPGARFFLFSKISRPTMGPTQSRIECVLTFFTGLKRLGREVDYTYPVLRVRMSGVIPLPPPYIFMTCKQTTSLFKKQTCESVNLLRL